MMLVTSVDDILHFGVILSVILRWAVSRFSYSGAGKPPMYGDYEAQRHWMEITYNLPAKDWYKNSTQNDLMYWGLDYPPLTAYHSMICGYFSNWFNPDWVSLNVSRGFESYHHKIFMRSTVLVADIIFFVPLILYWHSIEKPWNLRNKAIAASLCLMYPGLILIDHGHFQYNSVSLGFSLWGIVFLLWGHDLLGSAAFTLALHYKQMSLYYAIPFFCYLLGTCFKLPIPLRIAKISKLSSIVLIVTAICWAPFLQSLEDSINVLQRLFPLSRGLYEDKVANVWCMLSVFIKFKSIFPISTLAKISAISTFLTVLPSSLDLFLQPSFHKFRLALVNSSLCFFLLSFQVHEKSILFVALPVLLLLEEHPLACIWFACISTFSLVPLLAKDGLIIPFVGLSVLFLIGSLRAYENIVSSFKTKSETLAGLPVSIFVVSVLGSGVLLVCMFTLKQPAQYPHLHVLLNCLYSGVHFIGFAFYFHYLQYFEKPCNRYSHKLKSH